MGLFFQGYSIFSKHGFNGIILDLKIAKTGEAALNIVKQNASVIDLILLDIVLPGIDGITTCRKLKENLETMDIPVIFLTGQDEPKKEVNGFDVGAVDFIPKPMALKF